MENNTLDRILTRLDAFVEEVAEIDLPPLSPQFKTLSTTNLHCALVRHRVLNQYQVPNEAFASTRKEISIQKVLMHDAQGLSQFDYRELPQPVRGDFLLAKQWLAEFFKGFRHTYALRFPSRETYVSARGKTDLIYKLKDLAQWHCSPDLVDYVVNILLRNRSLLNVVKQRYREKYGKRGRDTLASLRLRCIVMHPGGTVHELRHHMVKFMFRACTKLTRVSRVTTVPKNNDSDRVITCECMWTMVAQLSYSTSLRAHMKNRLGFDLETRQDVHRALIRQGGATIDLSKASDSNYMAVLAQLWPHKQYKLLESMRTGIFEINAGGAHSYVPLRMFAPMGCGCTFEVMTLTLLAHTRVLDQGSSVFGDDIIIRGDVAVRLTRNLQNQGWVINEDKSFIDGPFRESCGAYCDLRTNSFLLSYDLPRPSTIAECFIFAHKVLQLGHCLPASDLRTLFVTLYADLHWLFPRDALREVDEVALRPTAGLVDYVFHVVCPVWLRNRRATWTSRVTRALSVMWQRDVYGTDRQTFQKLTRRPRTTVCSTWYAAYMRRGASYGAPYGDEKEVYVRVDTDSGTPFRSLTIDV